MVVTTCETNMYKGLERVSSPFRCRWVHVNSRLSVHSHSLSYKDYLVKKKEKKRNKTYLRAQDVSRLEPSFISTLMLPFLRVTFVGRVKVQHIFAK